jgi:sugar (pentulose or hexulose) kinase
VSELRRGVALAAQETGRSLDAIGIDTWGVDFGLLDGDGDLLGNPVHYRDSRTRGMFEAAFERMPKEEIFGHTGLAFQPFNTLYQLLALKLSKPAMLDAASSLLFMPDLLAYFLTGERATEYTDASTSQLLDAELRSWSDPVIEAMGFPPEIFTTIEEPGRIRGVLSEAIQEELQLGAVPVVAVASHDTASAVVAIPAEGNSTAYLSSGTWSLLGVELPAPVLTPEVLRWNLTNEGGFGGTIRLLRNVMGLWIVQECKRVWDAAGPPLSYEELVGLSTQSRPFPALIDPDDPVFYSPGDMPSVIRDFCLRTGQQAPESRGEIARTVYESLALRYRWTVEKLEEVTGTRIERLAIVGGGVKNSLLNQFTADALNRPVVGGYAEATALGNLLVQAHALGELSGLADIRRVVRASFPTEAFAPKNPGPWDEAYARFRQFAEAG